MHIYIYMHVYIHIYAKIMKNSRDHEYKIQNAHGAWTQTVAFLRGVSSQSSCPQDGLGGGPLTTENWVIRQSLQTSLNIKLCC